MLGQIKEQINQIEDPEILKQTLFALLDKVDNLENRLNELSNDEKSEDNSRLEMITEKKDRLERIRHGLNELTERMERPYLITQELLAVKEVLDTLAENEVCNSIIIEGEPGTGKTQWAYSEVGNELQEGKDVMLVHARIKDTMTAQDLLYSVDDVRRLSDAQAKATVPEKIRLEAQSWKDKIINGEINPAEDADYLKFKAKMKAVEELGETGKDLDYLNYVDLGPLGEAIYQSSKGKKVWLVIDEIEKGREELMTGMLDEIENLTFTIGETGTEIKGDKKNLRIVITTNTEDSDKIPSSFRRRSLYHFIEYPTREEMTEIVNVNFPDVKEELLDYALNTFYAYQNHPDIEKKPSTPELLAWLQVLIKENDGEIPRDIPHKEILLKHKEDKELNIDGIDIVEQKEKEMPNFLKKALEGKKIYKLTGEINACESQSEYSSFFAKLQNENINFSTPQFKETYDHYGDYDGMETVRRFQIIEPGIENLGEDYYVIPDDKIQHFVEHIDKMVEVLPEDNEFTDVYEKNSKFTTGTVNINGEDLEAFTLAGDKRLVITKNFTYQNLD